MKQKFTVRQSAVDGGVAVLSVSRDRRFRRTANEFDAGIRLGQFIAPDMVAVRLTKPFPFIVVGSPAYLARSGRPERPDDLRQHACLRLRRSNGALALWSLNDNGQAIEIAV